MCSHYQALKDRARLERQFDVQLPPVTGVYDVWPGYHALFIRRPLEADVGDEAVPISAAEAQTDSLRAKHSPCWKNRSFALSLDGGVLVARLKVLEQAVHRYRCRSRLWPFMTNLKLLQ